MYRVVLGDYVKSLAFGLEVQVNLVNWWNDDLQLWEQTYNLVVHWKTKKPFRKIEYNTVSLLASTDKDLVVRMFQVIQNGQDLKDNLESVMNPKK